ncbi:MAG: KpsF/GutQ family sugar-phosphate isomerase [Thermodesulfobacteriota bacterium]
MKQKKETSDIIRQAIDVLKTEAKGILDVAGNLDHHFEEAVDMICRTKGRVIISGIGKSGIVGQKIVATLNSTGTRALFLHPVEAMHGDLGVVRPKDIFLGLSNSGETEELTGLIPTIRNVGCKVIAFTGNTSSSLARQSDIVINVGVKKEACPLGLAPTTSTTALLAMGDALAVALIVKKKFKSSDFQRFHPGGTLGRRLALNVSEIMLTGDKVPAVPEKTPIETALAMLDRHNLGALLVVKKNHTLAGILTDGDIRRLLLSGESLSGGPIDTIMTKNPLTVHPDSPVYDALNILEQHQITALPVTAAGKKVCGILHLHDILGKGAFKFNGK